MELAFSLKQPDTRAIHCFINPIIVNHSQFFFFKYPAKIYLLFFK